MELRYRITGFDKRNPNKVLYAFNRLTPARRALRKLIREGKLTDANRIWDALRAGWR